MLGNNTYLGVPMDEAVRLIECCPSSLRPIVITAVCAGLRKGEIVHIRWNDIDFANRIIFIANTKNGEKREVPVNDYLTAILKSIKKTMQGLQLFL
jgi:integrase